MDAEIVAIEYDTIPGDDVTDKLLGKYCRLNHVYVSHHWGCLDGKLKRQRYSRSSPFQYEMYLQNSEGHAHLSFKLADIEEIVFIKGQDVPYYIKLKKG